ncbi:sulfurtransferase complex subunit TusC [Sansalvadorimonas sp. 2012CJ34-2]|uniref:Sulfurtransferase complex subunit TusC n=1 Tax=Parendozoicomonas callyspongiae TaxID=2942213 RepID=A0ABT0PC26_9GAMM|nr:sulfurtransferase complex subunit TusC [Sansalvadorimonas sp. 2012CJ34-2]MCL6268806.1 sulfurtransferase complex subunit TusC [Sansalvadorimonas sp. 2012CJ34-2]
MKFCFISSHAPYGSTLARDGIESLLVAASYDMNATVLFMGDGVLQLVAEQEPGELPQKNTGAMLQALEMYGIENILVCREDMLVFGLQAEQLLLKAKQVSRSDIPGIIREQDRVLNF